ncbi:F0F1 ATP synthase subunit A [Rhizomonospora bruguierae]|uniref:F0F1 ATP synthase subunit A n=1 Tax=Rhizomonospora bruguierae TaxID=1581705 RepID=UPI0020BFFE22|nr:F0F1 ATP synthase subunit A [Micromonospora sp. NBRC 107566]
MIEQLTVLAKDDLPFPPSVEDFFLPAIYPWGEANSPWVTKFTVLIWLAVAALIAFFLLAYRKPKLVPTRGQWMAESVYGFARDNVAKEIIGHEGVRFAPYLATLFSFILLTNIFGIIPFIQISPMSHIAFPAFLAIISYVLYNAAGIKKHGFWRYLKSQTMPPAPKVLYPLLIPLEFFSNLVLRPFTLALRLFANMFAGHIILLVFTLSGFVLLASDNFFIKAMSPFAWLMAIILTLFELLVAVLQAYVFTLLTAVYVQTSIATDH